MRTAIDPTPTASGGALVNFVAAPDVELSIANSFGDVAMFVKNGDAAQITATVQITKVVDGQSIDPKVITIDPDETKIIGPYSRTVYNQADGSVYIDLSASANVEVAAMKWVPV